MATEDSYWAGDGGSTSFGEELKKQIRAKAPLKYLNMIYFLLRSDASKSYCRHYTDLACHEPRRRPNFWYRFWKSKLSHRACIAGRPTYAKRRITPALAQKWADGLILHQRRYLPVLNQLQCDGGEYHHHQLPFIIEQGDYYFNTCTAPKKSASGVSQSRIGTVGLWTSCVSVLCD